MWIHLLSLGLIDGAGGQVIPPVIQQKGGGIEIAQRVTLSKKKKPLDYVEQLQAVAKQLNTAKPVNDTSSQLALQALENMRSIEANSKAAQIEIMRQIRAQDLIDQAKEDEGVAMILTLMM